MRTPSEELSSLVGEVAREAVARRYTLATAESCTGGWIAKVFTDLPGSSVWFRGGIISYADAVKIELLGIPAELLAENGAVSQPVAEAMAEGGRRRLGADWAIATSGVAGPDGGTVDKPVGRVCVAWASANGVESEQWNLEGDREAIRMATVQHALVGLLRRVG
jgi:nicotinamide-nucleotide amidase